MNNKKLIILNSNTSPDYYTMDILYPLVINYIHSVVKQQYNPDLQHIYPYEDLFSIANIGFIKAFDKYDITKNITFITFLYKVILNEIKVFKRLNKKHLKQYYLDENIKGFEDFSYNDFLIDIHNEVNFDNIISRPDYDEYLYIINNYLTSLEQLIIKLYTTGRYTQRQIAKITNTTQANVSRILINVQKKIKKFKELLEKDIYIKQLLSERQYTIFKLKVFENRNLSDIAKIVKIYRNEIFKEFKNIKNILEQHDIQI